MRIAGVGSAFPKYYHKQEVLVGALKAYWKDKLPQPGILDRLDESMKVDSRFTARPLDFYQAPPAIVPVLVSTARGFPADMLPPGGGRFQEVIPGPCWNLARA